MSKHKKAHIQAFKAYKLDQFAFTSAFFCLLAFQIPLKKKNFNVYNCGLAYCNTKVKH